MFDALLNMLAEIFEGVTIDLKLGFEGTFFFEGTIFLQSFVQGKVALLSNLTHRV
jgi:hypothetical protein